MNTIEHAVALPPNEVVVDRAARWKILRKVTPLAAGTEDIHHPVHGRAHVGSPLTAAWLGWRNERFHKRPLVIRQVARVSQVITIVFRAVLMRPHRGPPSNQAASLESQTIQGIQQVLGRTLSFCPRTGTYPARNHAPIGFVTSGTPIVQSTFAGAVTS